MASADSRDLWDQEFWKTCRRCRKAKPVSEFHRNVSRSDGRASHCKACRALWKSKAAPEKRQHWYKLARERRLRDKQQNPEKVRQRERKWQLTKFGLTLAAYEALLAKQGSVCAICKRPSGTYKRKHRLTTQLDVDHCHSSGRVRGLLCTRCNRALGLFRDDPQILQAAILYLETY
jgi:hypothetical protein